jgi:hypothetical protein
MILKTISALVINIILMLILFKTDLVFGQEQVVEVVEETVSCGELIEDNCGDEDDMASCLRRKKDQFPEDCKRRAESSLRIQAYAPKGGLSESNQEIMDMCGMRGMRLNSARDYKRYQKKLDKCLKQNKNR